MEFQPPLASSVFVRRENRYLALVEHGGTVVPAHVPNSGRMSELLVAGAPARIAPAGRPGRKTAWDLILVAYAGRWVSVDARLPPRLVQEALASRVLDLPGFPADLRREVARDGSRFDLAGLDTGGTPCAIEAKSVNLVEEGTALFPDVPTARGARHCRHLAQIARRGERAAIVFAVQREDVLRLAPHRVVDADFADALAEARDAGVLVRALRCRVTETGVAPAAEIPVVLR